jgi:tetratricopeptide (TPR) repeat protein
LRGLSFLDRNDLKLGLNKSAAWVGLATLMLLAWLAYRPGLSGGFLFDDFVNLDALGNSGPVDNLRTFWRYITSSTADPTGRPIALLSFLLDAHDWPADPAPFLRTNVILHLLNGTLLFVLLRKLEHAIAGTTPSNDAVPLLAAGMWILHPLFVSTTLYIVQREAMLPATFVLLGLIVYSKGRLDFSRSNGALGTSAMLWGIGAGTLLAILSKGNGALLPLLAWTLEATVFRRHPNSPGASTALTTLRRIRFSLLFLPSLILFAYIIHFLPQWNASLSTRSWTIGQRLLTEPRVVVDYLGLLLVPRSVSTGLYNDTYIASTGLLQPISTLFCSAGLLALFGSALLLRERTPRFSAAILFFFAGHLLESTTIPIELYFEHRNYLPALLLFWPLAHCLCTWKAPKAVRVTSACLLLALLAATTYQRTMLWGKPDRLAELWARKNPGSSRAQATAAIAELHAGRAVDALARLEPLWRQRPYDLQVAFNAINAACAAGGLDDSDKHRLVDALKHAPQGQLLVYRWIGNAIEVAATNQCPEMTLGDVQHWLNSALLNPAINNPHVRDQDIEPLLGQLALRQHRPVVALEHFNRALAAVTTPDVAARQASMLAAAGAYEQALAHLDFYERRKSAVRPPAAGMPWLHAKVLEWQGYWPFEMALLRKKLHAAIVERDREATIPPPTIVEH